MKRLVVLFSFVIFTTSMFAQMTVQDSIMSSWMFSFNLSGHLSAGDLADRYGNSLGLGMDIDRKTQKNWLFGVEGTYFFGNDVNNLYNIFGGLATSQGLLIGLNGEMAGVEFFQRGFYTGAHIGKIFTFLGHNANSGLLIKLGGGYVLNKIHIRAPGVQVPQIQGEYAKGYDRLHDGFALNQYIGYMYSGKSRTVNFKIGFEFIEGFTKNVRQYNYDTRLPDTQSKLDLYLGLKLTWFLPIYDKNQQKFYYY